MGKSFTIEVISQAADRILRKSGDNPLRPKVLLAAPTGIAAMLIGTVDFETLLDVYDVSKHFQVEQPHIPLSI